LPQPEGQPKYNDLIDIIIQSSQKTIDVQQKDGSYTKEQIIDDDTVWFKTGSVNANTYGRFALELKELLQWLQTICHQQELYKLVEK